MSGDRAGQFRQDAKATTDAQRAIQVEVDRRDEARAKKGGKEQKDEKDRAIQAGEREQPILPYREQHIAKPGREADLDPRPQYMAPDYRGSGKLEGRVALITGGDSGIGRAVAVLFAREGADVAIAYLSEDEDAEETRRAVEAEGRSCIAISGDVRDPRFCEFAVEETVRQLGHLDVLVNNAAFQSHVQSLEELSDEHLDMTLRTNIYGYIQMARAALPHLQRGSCIINTGSETGLFGEESLLDYSATKGAIHAFTKALATSVVKKGIRVNAVAPGPVWTPLNPADRPAAEVAQFGGGTDMKRPAQPEELAPAYVFLASPVTASYITGLVLPVIGGVTGAA